MSTSYPGPGVVFPSPKEKETSGAKENYDARSTTTTVKQILASAFQAASGISPSLLRNEPNSQWRFGYQKHFRQLCWESMQSTSSSSDCTGIEMARKGLQSAHDLFAFVREGKEEMSLKEAVRPGRFKGSFQTGVMEGQNGGGEKEKNTTESELFTLKIPFQGKLYQGEERVALAKKWVKDGQAEPTFASSIEEFVFHQESQLHKNLEGKVFILLGATSEMGPGEVLLQCGATVIAIARRGGGGTKKGEDNKWKSLMTKVKNSRGKLIYPIDPSVTVAPSQKQSEEKGEKERMQSSSEPWDLAGADAIAHTPEIINWLMELLTAHPLVKGQQPFIYSGIYLDGSKFVRATMAMEVIIEELTSRINLLFMQQKQRNQTQKRNNDDDDNGNAVPLGRLLLPSLLYIDTPAHFHAIPSEIYEGMNAQKKNAPWLMRLLAAGNFLLKAPVITPLIFRREGKEKRKEEGDGGLLEKSSDGLLRSTLPSSRCFFNADYSTVFQGPNYAMAKQLQRWRAIWSRFGTSLLFPTSSDDNDDHDYDEESGGANLNPEGKKKEEGERRRRRNIPRQQQLVSITTGPAAKTESVMHAKAFAVMMQHLDMVPPHCAYEPETVQAVMTMIMLRDIVSRRAFANPDNDNDCDVQANTRS